MAQLIPVKPGDLITADFFNTLLGNIADLQAQVALLGGNIGTGTVTVPSVFGRTLADARNIIIAPTTQLLLNSVVDATGTVINPTNPATATRLVIGQLPVPGERVAPGTSVNLVVAASSTSGGNPANQPPVVTGTDVVSMFPGGVVRIFGSNFAALFTDNDVRFAGVAAQVLPSSVSNRLDVVVPATIPGAPVLPTDSPLTGVSVTVATPGGGPVQTTMTIGPPPASPVPAIIPPLVPSTGAVGGSTNITGSNFSSVISGNTVTFDGIAGTVTAVNSGGAGSLILVVTIPTTIPGLAISGAIRTDVPVIVQVNGVSSVPLVSAFFRP